MYYEIGLITTNTPRVLINVKIPLFQHHLLVITVFELPLFHVFSSVTDQHVAYM